MTLMMMMTLMMTKMICDEQGEAERQLVGANWLRGQSGAGQPPSEGRDWNVYFQVIIMLMITMLMIMLITMLMPMLMSWMKMIRR